MMTVMAVVVVVFGCDRSSRRSTNAGAYDRAILATHLSTYRAAKRATESTANSGILHKIVRPTRRGESAPNDQQERQT